MNFYAESEEDRSHGLSATYAARAEIFVFKQNIFKPAGFRRPLLLRKVKYEKVQFLSRISEVKHRNEKIIIY